jgi:hypothetical protein
MGYAEHAAHLAERLVEPPPSRARDLPAPTGLAIELLDVGWRPETCAPRLASRVARVRRTASMSG